MKVFITGKNGQLGYELQKTAPDGVELYAYDADEFDITNESVVSSVVNAVQPNIIINAAAYTAVDKAEDEQETAFSVNRDGAKYLAQSAKEVSAKLIHISTDFIFSANKNTPYLPVDVAEPISVYGSSKLAGENAIADVYPEKSSIIRTSWVYSEHGNNFVKTMLRLMKEKSELGVVCDQIGSPTWAKGLARACWAAATSKESGIYHYSDFGVASWYDFAEAIQEIGLEFGLLDKAIPIQPIKTADYPTPAKRPAYSVMDTSKIRNELEIESLHWRTALREMMRGLV